jgi:hypothetical protein
MAVERRLKAVGPIAFTLDGGANGLVTVSDTKGFRVKAQVVLEGISLPNVTLEIKRVISKTQFFVGIKGDIKQRENISLYTLAASSTVLQPEQDRPGIPLEQHERAVYEEEPVLAKRVILVDGYGEFYDTDNPLKVQLSDGNINIGTVNAEIEVQLSHKDNNPDIGDIADSVQVGDGVDVLQINSDGSINVNIVQSSDGTENVLNIYDEITGIASGSETVIVSFTAISGRSYWLQRAEFTGEQIALYKLYVNNVPIAAKRTHHGSGLSGGFEFVGADQEGLPIDVGDVVELRLLHNRPNTGDFEGRIQIYEAIPLVP